MTAGEVISAALSVVAIALSLISLVWQIRRARADRPQVQVEGIVGYTVMNGDYSSASWEFDVSVTNEGREAVTIDTVCWRLVNSDGGVVAVKGSQVSDMMPMRLEGHDSRNFNYTFPAHGTRWDGLSGSPSVEFVRRRTTWDRLRKKSSRRILNGRPQRLHVPPEAKDRTRDSADSTPRDTVR